MSDSQRTHAELDRLLAEVRQREVPEVDWQRVEAQLGEKLSAGATHRLPPPSSLRWQAPLGAALAAAVVMFLLLKSPGEPETSRAPVAVAVPPETASSRHAATLQVGERLVAGSKPVQVKHPDRATWTLAPHSSCEIKELEPAIVVQLQSGSVEANVVPGLEPERFAVEVGGLRVAVQGTVFSVKRQRGQAEVEVTRGRVVVGPVNGAPRSLLQAPAFVRAQVLGEQAGQILAERGQVTDLKQPAPPVRRSLRGQPKALASAGGPVEVREPTFEEVERGLSQVEAALHDCLAQHTKGGAKVQLSLSTRLSLKVGPEGSLSDQRFIPPLAPTIASCVDPKLKSIQFAPSESGTHIIRDLEISPRH